jgi:hypothetical protein
VLLSGSDHNKAALISQYIFSPYMYSILVVQSRMVAWRLLPPNLPQSFVAVQSCLSVARKKSSAISKEKQYWIG